MIEIKRLRLFVAARLDPKTYLGLHLTIGLLVLGLALWAFGSLLQAVLDNQTLVRFDIATSVWVHARVTPGGLRFADIVSEVASPDIMAILGVVVAVVLWGQARRTACLAWGAAFIGGTAVQHMVKAAVHRSRPDYAAPFLSDKSFSFPSGHAMASIVGMGMLLYMLGRFWHPGRVWRLGSIVAGIAVVLLVGGSRIYLGVHYPSDVLGGYAAGTAWMAVCVSGLRVAEHQRARAAGLSSV
ncbi:MAG: phosphatase PAP2 family protein [bacterium]